MVRRVNILWNMLWGIMAFSVVSEVLGSAGKERSMSLSPGGLRSEGVEVT